MERNLLASIDSSSATRENGSSCSWESVSCMQFSQTKSIASIKRQKKTTIDIIMWEPEILIVHELGYSKIFH